MDSWMVRCFPYSETTGFGLDYEAKYQHSNKIVVSEILLNEIYNMSFVPNLLLFKLEKQRVNKSKQKTYLSIAAECHHVEANDVFHIIYLPDRIFNLLKIKSGAVSELIKIVGKIKPGTYVKFQPSNQDLFNIDNYQTYLQEQLNKNYTSLSLSDTITIPYFDRCIELQIIDLKPENKVTIVDADLTVEFEYSLETLQHLEDIQGIIESEKKEEEKQQQPPEKEQLPEEQPLSIHDLRKARLAALEKKNKSEIPNVAEVSINSKIPGDPMNSKIPEVPINSEIPECLTVPMETQYDEDVKPTKEQLREIRLKCLMKK